MGAGKESNNNTTGAYDLGELDQALSLSDHDNEQQLTQIPSQPMHVEPSTPKANIGVVEGGQPTGGGSKRPSEQPPPIELSNTANNNNNNNNKLRNQHDTQAEQSKSIKKNIEAARKSMLREKMSVEEVESCRIRLEELKQELREARAQAESSRKGLEQIAFFVMALCQDKNKDEPKRS